jgi:hypothetical protein
VAFVNPHSTVEGAYHASAVRCVDRIPIFQAEPGQIFLPVIQLLTPTSSVLTSRHHTAVVHTVLVVVTGGALANKLDFGILLTAMIRVSAISGIGAHQIRSSIQNGPGPWFH